MKVLGKHILCTDGDFDDQVTSGGIVIRATIGKPEGITPRWFRVAHVGPEIDWLTPGIWVLVEYGRWTDSFEVEGTKYWKIDPEGCAATCNEKPQDMLNVASDSIFAPKLNR